MEQIKLFLEKAQSDSELAAKLEEMRVKDAGVEEFIILAVEHGFTITKEELEQPPKVSGELSEEQLEDITGGKTNGSNCWFVLSGTQSASSKRNNRFLCNNRTRCRFYQDRCKCFGMETCDNGKHSTNTSCTSIR